MNTTAGEEREARATLAAAAELTGDVAGQLAGPGGVVVVGLSEQLWPWCPGTGYGGCAGSQDGRGTIAVTRVGGPARLAARLAHEACHLGLAQKDGPAVESCAEQVESTRAVARGVPAVAAVP